MEEGNHLEKRSGEKNVDSRIQVKLEEDGGGSTKQSLYVPPRATRHKLSQVTCLYVLFL